MNIIDVITKTVIENWDYIKTLYQFEDTHDTNIYRLLYTNTNNMDEADMYNFILLLYTYTLIE
jgi:hypothetical protein